MCFWCGNRISRNGLDVSGVLQNLFVATAAKLCGHSGKNTVVSSCGRARNCASTTQPYGLSPPTQSLRHAVAASQKWKSGRRAGVPEILGSKAGGGGQVKRIPGQNMENALALEAL
jgi:hypothetical protein